MVPWPLNGDVERVGGHQCMPDRVTRVVATAVPDRVERLRITREIEQKPAPKMQLGAMAENGEPLLIPARLRQDEALRTDGNRALRTVNQELELF